MPRKELPLFAEPSLSDKQSSLQAIRLPKPQKLRNISTYDRSLREFHYHQGRCQMEKGGSLEANMSSGEPPRAERSGTLIELRRGGPRNFFLVHDGDGNTLLYLDLARRMPDDLTVLGIAPRSIAGVPLAHTRIEDMAGFYVNEVRKKQPHGPYLLGGLCAGGVIAYEMVLQLIRAGERVELVALLDAATPQAPKRRGFITNQRFGRVAQALADARKKERSTIGRALFAVSAVSRKLVNALMWEITRHGERWWVSARFHLLHQLLARQLPWPEYIPELSVRQIYESAHDRYVPKPLRSTSAVLVRARRRGVILSDTPYRAIYADETLGWAAIIQGLVVIDVDGGHSTMLQEPFVKVLAAALMPHINHRSESVQSRSVESTIP